jgi:hypothetical protein
MMRGLAAASAAAQPAAHGVRLHRAHLFKRIDVPRAFRNVDNELRDCLFRDACLRLELCGASGSSQPVVCTGQDSRNASNYKINAHTGLILL